MEKIKLTYTEQMQKQDNLSEQGLGDSLAMKSLHKLIIDEAISKGWGGSYVFMTQPCFENYCKNTSLEKHTYTRCIDVIKRLEEDLNQDTNLINIEMVLSDETKNYKISVLDDFDDCQISYLFYNLHGRQNRNSKYPEDNLEPIRTLNMTVVQNEPLEIIIEVPSDCDVSKYLDTGDIEYTEVFGEWCFGHFKETYNPKIDKAIGFLIEKETEDNKEIVSFMLDILTDLTYKK